MLALKPHTGNCFLILATWSAEAPRERTKKHKTTELPVIMRLITKQTLVSFPTICFVLVWDFLCALTAKPCLGASNCKNQSAKLQHSFHRVKITCIIPSQRITAHQRPMLMYRLRFRLQL